MQWKFFLSIIIIIFIGIGIYIFFANSYHKLPSENELSSKAGFEVLIPRNLPNNYSFNGYKITNGEGLTSTTVTLEFSKEGRGNILVAELVKKDDKDAMDKLFRLFSRFSPQYMNLANFKAIYVIKSAREDDSIKQILLTWQDEKRQMNIWFNQDTDFNQSEVVKFGESFYSN